MKLIAIDFGGGVYVRFMEGDQQAFPHEMIQCEGFHHFKSMDEVRSLVGKPETRIERIDFHDIATGYAFIGEGIRDASYLNVHEYNALCKIAGKELAWKGGEWRKVDDLPTGLLVDGKMIGGLPFDVWEYEDI